MKISKDMRPYLEDMLEKFAADLGKEIDFDVLSSTLADSGWTLVHFEPFNSRKNAVDIVTWVEYNSSGKWHNLGTKFIFELEKDVTAAILKWK